MCKRCFRLPGSNLHRSVLTWISVYWFSRAGPAASVRIYYEVIQDDPGAFRAAKYSPIPLGLSFFPKELVIVPRL